MMRGLVVLLIAAFALAGCGGDEAADPEPTGAASNGIENLDNILALRSDFEADAGKPRVLLLFSPT
ncbi:MAG: hypothetical protein ABIR67_01115 [Gaiellaceae bacterium]